MEKFGMLEEMDEQFGGNLDSCDWKVTHQKDKS